LGSDEEVILVEEIDCDDFHEDHHSSESDAAIQMMLADKCRGWKVAL